MDETWTRGIVVGVDGSPESYHAFDWARAAAARHHVPLTVSHAEAVPIGPITPVPAYEIESLQSATQRILSRVNDRIEPADRGAVHVDAVPSVGAPAPALVHASRDVDLVVVGRRGADVTRHLLGSVSSTVVAHAHGPAAVVPIKARPGDPERVVVGIGFDDDPTAPLELAFAEAHAAGCPVVLLHAVQRSTRVACEAGAGRVAGVEAALKGLAYRWKELAPDVECREEVRTGDPVDILLEHVTPSDLLVLGGHRHPRFVGRLLGSVPDVLLGDAPCVVAVAHTARPHAATD
ncbi:universal stress protein [Isoptericola chiayiensis]|uniref:Universal stress protein n=2 Tax=Isoptericola chiayiensis TaxID=579446 RepID=A0ABP8YHD6_9MICO